MFPLISGSGWLTSKTMLKNIPGLTAFDPQNLIFPTFLQNQSFAYKRVLGALNQPFDPLELWIQSRALDRCA